MATKHPRWITNLHQSRENLLWHLLYCFVRTDAVHVLTKDQNYRSTFASKIGSSIVEKYIYRNKCVYKRLNQMKQCWLGLHWYVCKNGHMLPTGSVVMMCFWGESSCPTCLEKGWDMRMSTSSPPPWRNWECQIIKMANNASNQLLISTLDMWWHYLCLS